MPVASKECDSLRERVARIETRLNAHVDQDDVRDANIQKVVSKLDKIDQELSRYRGFVGGILLMVTAVVSFIKMFGNDVKSFVLGQ
jgi:hypothetical protein